jgi:glutamate-1-semialdehyde 2,1-aminomutase
MPTQNEKWFDQAKKSIPGGVNSPVRAYKAVGGTPPFITRGSGSHIWDVDGNEYIDYVGSWGPLLLGHARSEIVDAVQRAAADGTSFGAPTTAEVEIAELICSLVPSVEVVRLVNSGTEACMSAIRLARGATGRDKIVKFAGCYHGHADSFLIEAGSGAATFGTPSSPGVTEGTAQDTLNAQYNDLVSVDDILSANQGQIAAIIVEPVAGNMGCVPPATGFLEGLRERCDANGIVLIFDEVMTGFRVARGGAQERFGITPDLTTLGKVIGGGLPMAAYGGREDLMRQIAPDGPVYQAGTLSGNPLAVAAGLAMLGILNEQPELYTELERIGARLEAGVRAALKSTGTVATPQRVGAMSCLYFSSSPVTDWDSAADSNTDRFNAYFQSMSSQGIYLAPSQFEAGFVSTVHTDEDIDRTIAAIETALIDSAKAGA